LPIGSALGMYLLDKWIYGPPKNLVLRILISFLIGISGFKLVTIWATQGQKDILLSPLPSELFLHPVIIAFFSLTGYLLAGLFRNKKAESGSPLDGENNLTEENGEASATLGKKLWRFIIAILFLGILTVLSFTAIFLLTPPAAEIEAAGVEKFFQQFLTSIINNTDFYKAHSSESAIQNIKNSRSLFSGSYDHYRQKCQQCLYEYSIVFDKKHDFEVKIEGTNRNFVVSDFKYGGIVKVRSWSDTPMTEEATNFFKQIISSINNSTDFYKKHSIESAIKEIQTYRSMISNDNVLVYRHWEGEYDYFFYVEFDEKHGFEVHIEAPKNGCLVKSFTYLGERGKWKIRWLDGVSH